MADGNEKKGEVKEVLGAVTGDRRVEAEGRVEQKRADPGTGTEAVTEDTVAREERDVKKDHHDVAAADGSREAPLGT
ncbi:MAG: hypothetical protein QOK39_1997 [Acidimicrobiaceae bacterium]|jgi:uncharacterized protein YjbJ (UPF0337 family)|nr:hypothetical protein [Acidimicrobiaceae bacterium]